MDDGSGDHSHSPSVWAMATYEVDPERLRQAAEQLGRAAAAANAVVDHPGVVRGRAQDGGCVQLRDAAARFARRWEHGLSLLADDLGRSRDVLMMVVTNYEAADDVASRSFSWAPGSRGGVQR